MITKGSLRLGWKVRMLKGASNYTTPDMACLRDDLTIDAYGTTMEAPGAPMFPSLAVSTMLPVPPGVE